MSESSSAVVVGVGPEEGLGAALCRKLAAEGLHVYVSGRTQEKLEACVKTITARGGRATPVVADTTSEEDVVRLFETAAAPELVVFNAGNMVLGEVKDMAVATFEQAWRIGCFGGFLVGREAVRRMLPRGRGTILFTGATASIRGRGNTIAFASAKFGLRALAQGMARGYGPQGIHVAHVVIDGAIAGEKIRKGLPQAAAALGEDGMISLDGLAEAYWALHVQPKTAWTHEIDIRTYKETW